MKNKREKNYCSYFYSVFSQPSNEMPPNEETQLVPLLLAIMKTCALIRSQ